MNVAADPPIEVLWGGGATFAAVAYGNGGVRRLALNRAIRGTPRELPIRRSAKRWLRDGRGYAVWRVDWADDPPSS